MAGSRAAQGDLVRFHQSMKLQFVVKNALSQVLNVLHTIQNMIRQRFAELSVFQSCSQVVR